MKTAEKWKNLGTGMMVLAFPAFLIAAATFSAASVPGWLNVLGKYCFICWFPSLLLGGIIWAIAEKFETKEDEP